MGRSAKGKGKARFMALPKAKPKPKPRQKATAKTKAKASATTRKRPCEPEPTPDEECQEQEESEVEAADQTLQKSKGRRLTAADLKIPILSHDMQEKYKQQWKSMGLTSRPPTEEQLRTQPMTTEHETAIDIMKEINMINHQSESQPGEPTTASSSAANNTSGLESATAGMGSDATMTNATAETAEVETSANPAPHHVIVLGIPHESKAEDGGSLRNDHDDVDSTMNDNDEARSTMTCALEHLMDGDGADMHHFMEDFYCMSISTKTKPNVAHPRKLLVRI